MLAGITRASIIELAKSELGLEVIERSVNRSELYLADELFLCGTAAEVTPVLEIDRRAMGDGEIGAIAQAVRTCISVVRGQHEVTPPGCCPCTDWCPRTEGEPQ